MQRPNVKRLAPTLLFAAALLTSSEVQAQDLEVVLSCPAGANDPDAPSNPQVSTLTCAPGACVCKVFYANRSASSLSNVIFRFRGEALPDLTLHDPTLDPDGNLGQQHLNPNFFNDPTFNILGRIDAGFTLATHRSVLMQVRNPTTQAGVSQSSYLRTTETHVVAGETVTTEGGWNFTVASIPAGQTGEFSFGMWLAGEPTVDPTFTRRLLLIAEHPSAAMPSPRVVNARPDLAPNPTFVGASNVDALETTHHFTNGAAITTGSWQGLLPEPEFDLYLPYYDPDTGSVRADEAYDPLEGHALIYDLASGTVTGTLSGCWSGACLVSPYTIAWAPGTTAGPATGPNANQALRLVPGTNLVRYRPGLMGHSWQARIAYDFDLAPGMEHLRAPGTVFPAARYCAWSGVSGATPTCTATTIRIVAMPTNTSGVLTYFGLNSQGNGSNPIYVGLEPDAIRANGSLRVDVRANVAPWTALAPLSNLDLTSQLWGDSERRIAATRIELWNSGSAALPKSAAYEIWVHPGGIAGAYGSESNLALRTRPAPTDPGWVRCIAASADTFPACTQTTLAEAGAPFPLSEVEFASARFPHVPLGAQGSVFMFVTGVVDGARTRIDGDADLGTEYDPVDMTTSSVGGRGFVDFSIEGLSFAVSRTAHAEYDPRLRGRLDLRIAPSGPLAPNASTALGTLPFVQTVTFGPSLDVVDEAPAYTPVTFEIDLSQAPTFDFGPSASAALAVRTLAGAPLPAGLTSTTTWDPITRIARVTVDSVSGTPVPIRGRLHPERAPNEMFGLYAYLTGRFLPGPTTQRVGTRIVTAYDHLDQRIPVDQRNTGIYTLGGGAPALAIRGEASRPLVEAHGAYTIELSASNRAYTDAGALLGSPATGSALSTAVYFRVNRDGDFPNDGGITRARFVGAASTDALRILISTAESPTRANAAQLTAPNGWTPCTIPCAPDNPEAVRWVAFDFGEVGITDALPRAPSAGNDRPFRASVALVDDGSEDGTTLYGRVEAASSNTASPAVSGALEVEVDADCDASQPGVGFDQPEICDALDNDCDGAINEGLTREVACPGLCPTTGIESCDPTGTWGDSTCADAVVCDDDDLCTADACVDGVCVNAPPPACPEPSANSCEVGLGCDPATGQCRYADTPCTELVFYGVLEDAAGTAVGSFRCRRLVGGGIVCDHDNGVLVVSPDLVCGP